MKKISPLLLISTILALFLLILFLPQKGIEVSASNSKPLIVLDPGHGGSDSGAVGNLNGKNIYEKNLNLSLALRVKGYLDLYNTDVRLTRTTDKYISLQDRAKFANDLNADLFVSLHHDSSTRTTANGISTHYSSYRPNLNTDGVYVNYNGVNYTYVKETNSPATLYYKDSNGVVRSVNMNYASAYDRTPLEVAIKSRELSLMLANAIANLGYNRMYSTTGSRDANYYVTRKTNMTSLLIENGFVSNPSELAKISNPVNQDKTARAIANTIIQFYNLNKEPVIMNKVSTDKSSPQITNNTIKISANASGGSELMYKFHIFDGKEWRVLQDYSSQSYFNWTPTLPGDYKISVHVRDKNSNREYDSYGAFEYTIAEPIKITGILMDKVSPQQKNTPVKFTLNVTGGTKILYKFNIFDGEEWKVVQDYSESNTFNWVPDKTGSYKMSIHVKDSSSVKDYDTYHAFFYDISEPIKITGLNYDKLSPQQINTAIELSVNAVGGSNKQYKFNIFDGEEWVVLQDYSPVNSVKWTPEKEGKYKISVHVKDATSTKEYDQYIWANYDITNDNVSFYTDLLSPQHVNDNVKLIAKPIDDTLYKFEVVKDGTREVLREFSAQNTVDWMPKSAGNFTLVLYKKQYNSVSEYDSKEEIDFQITIPPVRAERIIPNLASPQEVNSTIQLTTLASGGTEKLYKYNVFNGEEWIVLRDYSPDNTFNWAPTKKGDYQFSVHIKDKESSNEYDDYITLSYTIEVYPVQISGIDSSFQSPQPEGTTIKLTANARGGNDKLYKFHVFDGNEWKVLRDYAPSNEYNWTPPSDGEYKLVVHVKDSLSTKEYDDYTSKMFTVEDVPVRVQSLNTSLVSPQPVGTTIKLIANAVGGTEKLYKFHMFDGKEWKILRDYAPSNEYNWTPPLDGEYKLVVHVKDKASKKDYDSYTSKKFIINKVPVKMTGVNMNYESPQAANTKITLTANAIGGVEKLYKFHVFDGESWQVIRDYSLSNLSNWTPSKPGQYKISIHVKDRNSTKDYDDYYAFEYTIVDPVSVSDVNYEWNTDSGELVVDVDAIGGTRRLYKYWVLEPESKEWKVLQEYTSRNSFSWFPTSKGEYKISVHVKDISSSRQYDDYGAFNFTIN